MGDLLRYWPIFLGIAIPTCQAIAAAHVLLKRRDVRASAGWMGLIWLAPVIGVILYALFGINRIKRRARVGRLATTYGRDSHGHPVEDPVDLRAHLGEGWRHLHRLAPLGERVTDRPLRSGCRIEPLIDGESAYTAMLESIAEATTSIALLSYIFDVDHVGERFREELGKAAERGVEVRVLIDAVGAKYSTPPMIFGLKKHGVEAALFMPVLFKWRTRFVNLRNHRKILVVDGKVAFTGGMNIRGEFWPESPEEVAAGDLHFRVEGPVVTQIQETFAEDWEFATGEHLEGDRWFPLLQPVGEAVARGISDGPDADYEKQQLVLLGALSVARSSVLVITPYFLPDQQLISALNVAALRGVSVEVLVPSKGNQPIVQWASNAQLEQMLERGVRIFETPPPFDHSKLMVVDGCWVLLGSANWDPRSLQLNFEFNVEAYDPPVASRLGRLFEEKRDAAREVSLEDLRSRPLFVKLRDGVARLFSPYL